jgi:hypothetical protein
MTAYCVDCNTSFYGIMYQLNNNCKIARASLSFPLSLLASLLGGMFIALQGYHVLSCFTFLQVVEVVNVLLTHSYVFRLYRFHVKVV